MTDRNPAPEKVAALAALDEAIEIIETADHRASAVDGPVGHVRDEMTDKEWRRLYLALRFARKQVAGYDVARIEEGERLRDLRAAVELCDQRVHDAWGRDGMVDFYTFRAADWNRVLAVARGHLSEAAMRTLAEAASDEAAS